MVRVSGMNLCAGFRQDQEGRVGNGDFEKLLVKQALISSILAQVIRLWMASKMGICLISGPICVLNRTFRFVFSQPRI